MTPPSQSAGGTIHQIHGGTPLPSGVRLGDYDVTGVVHQSGFGVVYIGVDRSSPRKVAIKEYLPATLADRMADGSVVVRSLRYQQSFREGMQGFLSEARTLADLAEPALVKVLGYWEQNGTAYMAMPLYEGRTLKDTLRDSRRPSEAWLKAMVAPLLDALATLHQSNRYPCDVTPDNILIRSDGAALLFDLGIARRTIASTTEDVTVVLKPGFAPIEQYARDPSMPEGPWTDIYAVASVLRFAITGKTPPAPATRIVSDTMKPLGEVASDFSKEFLDGIDRGLAVRPEHRPQTVTDFRTALGIPPSASAELPVDAPTTSTPATDPDEHEATRPIERSLLARVDPQDGARVRVLGDGTKVTPPPAPLPKLGLPPASSQSTTGSRFGGWPRKFVVSLIVVGLAGIGLLVWILGGSDQAPPGAANTALSPKPAPTSAQPSLPAATPLPSAETATPPVISGEGTPTRVPSTQVATPSPESRPSSTTPTAPAPDPQTDVARTVSDSNLPVAPVASPAPAARSAKIQFSIKPWGEIVVDGRSRGVSPPLKTLSLPEGRHRIEIRNSTFPGYANEVDLKPGSSVSIAHSFKAP